MDCDGVLTDGRLYFTEAGEAMKVFHVRDGQGLSLWHKAGFRSGIITGRGSKSILKLRCDELGIEFLKTLSVNKEKDLERILAEAGVTADETAYIGDDIGDLNVLKAVGFSAAPSDAHPSIHSVVDYVTSAPGGFGAVREVIDVLLAAKKNG
ncbi:MAG: HAD hydrolase family protein [Chloracidobacterium sp.]|nr:HAD hydrolase family protein [Chloracidobacterium sp.]